MPRRNPASKEPPENSLAIASFQMIAGGEPQRGASFFSFDSIAEPIHNGADRAGTSVPCWNPRTRCRFMKKALPVQTRGPLRVCLQYAVFPGIPCLSATAFRAAVALSLPLASPVRPYSGACRNGKRENRSSAFPEKRGRQGLLAGKLSRIFLMKRKKVCTPN